MAGFRDRVDLVRKIVRDEGEVSITKLAYMMNVTPQSASHLLKAASEIDREIVYYGGVARYVPSDIKEPRGGGREG